MSLRAILAVAFTTALLLLPSAVEAEGPAPSPAAAPAADTTDRYSAAELQELVGPIALYPDVVLSSLLPATTVPLDVVMAARYVKEHEGQAIEDVPAEGQGWDASVQAMLQYPDVLLWMNDNLSWMEQLAWAVSVQEGDVLAAIQAFRKTTQEAGNLQSNEQVTVSQMDAAQAVEAGYTDPSAADGSGDTIIVIEPANPEIVYVPTYDPAVVVRPYYGPAPLYGWGWGFAAGVLGAWAWHGIHWGWHGHWGSININHNVWHGRPGYHPGRPPAWHPPNRPGAGRPPQRPPGGVRPPARPPAGNRPGTRPPGNRPGGGMRPPSQRPDFGGGSGRPGSGRPPLGGSGGTRPARPSRPPSLDRPGTPSTLPSTRPGSRPAPGTTRPGGTWGGSNGSATNRQGNRGNQSLQRPGTRPSTPGTRPSTRPSSPGSRPSTRPSTPSTRPSTRPSTPSTRPSPSTRSRSPSAFGGRSSGSSARGASSRGSRSMGRSGGSRGGGGRRR